MDEFKVFASHLENGRIVEGTCYFPTMKEAREFAEATKAEFDAKGFKNLVLVWDVRNLIQYQLETSDKGYWLRCLSL